MLTKKVKKEPTVANLVFEDHPIRPDAYLYCVVKFANGEGLSICKRKKNETHFPKYGYTIAEGGKRLMYNNQIKFEVMRFNKSGERFDNVLLGTEPGLDKMMTQVANIGARESSAGSKPKRAAAARKRLFKGA